MVTNNLKYIFLFQWFNPSGSEKMYISIRLKGWISGKSSEMPISNSYEQYSTFISYNYSYYDYTSTLIEITVWIIKFHYYILQYWVRLSAKNILCFRYRKTILSSTSTYIMAYIRFLIYK